MQSSSSAGHQQPAIAQNKQSGSLRQRIFRAGIWTLGGYAAGQALRLGSNLIMTRLLAPEMFGIMALANVVMVGLALFSDIGIHQSIVRSQAGRTPAFLNTAWTIQILRGVILWLVALSIAGAFYLLGHLRWFPADSTYANPALPGVVAALSFTALIGGFVSTRQATANRDLALGRVTLVELGSQIVALLSMILWAMIDRSIWALVAGTLIGSFAKTFLSHTVLPGEKNRFHLDRQIAREILGFGKWIVLSSVLGFLALNSDRLMLGGMIDAGTLGLYSIAIFIVGALQDVLARLGANIAFPAFSEVVRERPAALREVYYKFRLPLDAAALVAMGLLMSSGHLLISLLYDHRYQAAGPMVEILCIGLFEVRYWLAGQCFIALGKPKLMVPGIVIRLIVIFCFLPVAFSLWGLKGALWVIGVNTLFSLPLTIFLKVKCGLWNIRRELMVLPLLPVGYFLGLLVSQMIGWRS
jgi:O-antigen/teichoic acid export membrane protein